MNIKNLIRLGVWMALLNNFFVCAQEYVIDMQYKDASQKNPMQMVWHIGKKIKIRVLNEYDGKKVWSSLIADPATSTIRMYDENPENGKKIFYTISSANIQPDARFDYKRGKATVTNETKNIAGYECRKVVFNTDKFTAEFWVTSTLPDIKPWAGYFRSFPELQGMEEAGLSGFPLSSVIKDPSGSLIASFEVKQVKSGSFEPSFFDVPADYIDARMLQRK
ncbi:MAG: DUF4412 domain-containing protein [Chitinophagales bacterium]|nr:DUF4412 domain-containing protein [Chitinophagales bacterium]